MSESRLPRTEKINVGQGLVGRLVARLAKGPAEPPLDGFASEIKAIVLRLENHVDGVSTLEGTRAALLVASDESDDDVCTWTRKIEGVIDAEAKRRTGPNVERAQKLYQAAFPHGRAYIEARVSEKNTHSRSAINALMAPENQGTLVAIGMPSGWIASFEAAIAKSDADFDALAKERSNKSTHIDLGRDAERDWVDAVKRLRHYVEGRAKRGELEKKNEGKELLEPLLSALRKLRVDAETRATLRKKKAAPKPAPKPASDRTKEAPPTP